MLFIQVYMLVCYNAQEPLLFIIAVKLSSTKVIHAYVSSRTKVLKDWPIGHKNVVSQDRWSLVTGSIILKCWLFCQEYVVFQDMFTIITSTGVLSFASHYARC